MVSHVIEAYRIAVRASDCRGGWSGTVWRARYWDEAAAVLVVGSASIARAARRAKASDPIDARPT